MNDATRPSTDERTADARRRLAELADRYWQMTLEASPTSATLLGVHDHDDRLEDLSESGDAVHRASLRAVREELDALPLDALDGPHRVTAEMLAHQLDQAMEWIDLRFVELASDQMMGVHASLLMVAPQLNYPTAENAESALIRYEQVPRLLGDALDRFRSGLRVGRTPAACVLARSLNTLDGYLASDTASDPFLAAGLPQEWSDAPAWRDEVTQLVSDRIRPAFEMYRAAIVQELVPLGRDDEHAGWSALPDGEQMYAAMVRRHTTSSRSPEELHALGRELCESVLPVEFAAIAPEVFGTDELTEIYGRIRTDPALRHRDAVEVVQVAEQSVHRASESLDGWFGRRPSTPCVVEPIPDFLAADAPYAYYFPPATDGSRPGTYFINTAQPSESSRTEAESIAFHEAVPGHHLQIAIAQELDGLPEFRRHDGPTAYIEGWALYAERLADEMGLYSGPLDRLGMLTADAWRSARLVVDTGLHAFGWSRQRAIDYFEAHTPVPIDQIATEVDRYAAMPGQALSYKVGQLEIERLRRSAAQRLGQRFSLPGFHDVVLGSGAVTLSVLDVVVDGWVSASSGAHR